MLLIGTGTILLWAISGLLTLFVPFIIRGLIAWRLQSHFNGVIEDIKEENALLTNVTNEMMILYHKGRYLMKKLGWLIPAFFVGMFSSVIVYLFLILPSHLAATHTGMNAIEFFLNAVISTLNTPAAALYFFLAAVLLALVLVALGGLIFYFSYQINSLPLLEDSDDEALFIKALEEGRLDLKEPYAFSTMTTGKLIDQSEHPIPKEETEEKHMAGNEGILPYDEYLEGFDEFTDADKKRIAYWKKKDRYSKLKKGEINPKTKEKKKIIAAMERYLKLKPKKIRHFNDFTKDDKKLIKAWRDKKAYEELKNGDRKSWFYEKERVLAVMDLYNRLEKSEVNRKLLRNYPKLSKTADAFLKQTKTCADKERLGQEQRNLIRLFNWQSARGLDSQLYRSIPRDDGSERSIFEIVCVKSLSGAAWLLLIQPGTHSGHGLSRKVLESGLKLAITAYRSCTDNKARQQRLREIIIASAMTLALNKARDKRFSFKKGIGFISNKTAKRLIADVQQFFRPFYNEKIELTTATTAKKHQLPLQRLLKNGFSEQGQACKDFILQSVLTALALRPLNLGPLGKSRWEATAIRNGNRSTIPDESTFLNARAVCQKIKQLLNDLSNFLPQLAVELPAAVKIDFDRLQKGGWQQSIIGLYEILHAYIHAQLLNKVTLTKQQKKDYRACLLEYAATNVKTVPYATLAKDFLALDAITTPSRWPFTKSEKTAFALCRLNATDALKSYIDALSKKGASAFKAGCYDGSQNIWYAAYINGNIDIVEHLEKYHLNFFDPTTISTPKLLEVLRHAWKAASPNDPRIPHWSKLLYRLYRQETPITDLPSVNAEHKQLATGQTQAHSFVAWLKSKKGFERFFKCDPHVLKTLEKWHWRKGKHACAQQALDESKIEPARREILEKILELAANGEEGRLVDDFIHNIKRYSYLPTLAYWACEFKLEKKVLPLLRQQHLSMLFAENELPNAYNGFQAAIEQGCYTIADDCLTSLEQQEKEQSLKNWLSLPWLLGQYKASFNKHAKYHHDYQRDAVLRRALSGWLGTEWYNYAHTDATLLGMIKTLCKNSSLAGVSGRGVLQTLLFNDFPSLQTNEKGQPLKTVLPRPLLTHLIKRGAISVLYYLQQEKIFPTHAVPWKDCIQHIWASLLITSPPLIKPLMAWFITHVGWQNTVELGSLARSAFLNEKRTALASKQKTGTLSATEEALLEEILSYQNAAQKQLKASPEGLMMQDEEKESIAAVKTGYFDARCPHTEIKTRKQLTALLKNVQTAAQQCYYTSFSNQLKTLEKAWHEQFSKNKAAQVRAEPQRKEDLFGRFLFSQADDGNTLLHSICRHGGSYWLNYLKNALPHRGIALLKQAFSIKNDQGLTAIEIAIYQKRFKLVTYFFITLFSHPSLYALYESLVSDAVWTALETWKTDDKSNAELSVLRKALANATFERIRSKKSVSDTAIKSAAQQLIHLEEKKSNTLKTELLTTVIHQKRWSLLSHLLKIMPDLRFSPKDFPWKNSLSSNYLYALRVYYLSTTTQKTAKITEAQIQMAAQLKKTGQNDRLKVLSNQKKSVAKNMNVQKAYSLLEAGVFWGDKKLIELAANALSAQQSTPSAKRRKGYKPVLPFTIYQKHQKTFLLLFESLVEAGCPKSLARNALLEALNYFRVNFKVKDDYSAKYSDWGSMSDRGGFMLRRTKDNHLHCLQGINNNLLNPQHMTPHYDTALHLLCYVDFPHSDKAINQLFKKLALLPKAMLQKVLKQRGGFDFRTPKEVALDVDNKELIPTLNRLNIKEGSQRSRVGYQLSRLETILDTLEKDESPRFVPATIEARCARGDFSGCTKLKGVYTLKMLYYAAYYKNYEAFRELLIGGFYGEGDQSALFFKGKSGAIQIKETAAALTDNNFLDAMDELISNDPELQDIMNNALHQRLSSGIFSLYNLFLIHFLDPNNKGPDRRDPYKSRPNLFLAHNKQAFKEMGVAAQLFYTMWIFLGIKPSFKKLLEKGPDRRDPYKSRPNLFLTHNKQAFKETDVVEQLFYTMWIFLAVKPSFKNLLEEVKLAIKNTALLTHAIGGWNLLDQFKQLSLSENPWSPFSEDAEEELELTERKQGNAWWKAVDRVLQTSSLDLNAFERLIDNTGHAAQLRRKCASSHLFYDGNTFNQTPFKIAIDGKRFKLVTFFFKALIEKYPLEKLYDLFSSKELWLAFKNWETESTSFMALKSLKAFLLTELLKSNSLPTLFNLIKATPDLRFAPQDIPWKKEKLNEADLIKLRLYFISKVDSKGAAPAVQTLMATQLKRFEQLPDGKMPASDILETGVFLGRADIIDAAANLFRKKQSTAHQRIKLPFADYQKYEKLFLTTFESLIEGGCSEHLAMASLSAARARFRANFEPDKNYKAKVWFEDYTGQCSPDQTFTYHRKSTSKKMILPTCFQYINKDLLKADQMTPQCETALHLFCRLDMIDDETANIILMGKLALLPKRLLQNILKQRSGYDFKTPGVLAQCAGSENLAWRLDQLEIALATFEKDKPDDFIPKTLEERWVRADFFGVVGKGYSTYKALFFACYYKDYAFIRAVLEGNFLVGEKNKIHDFSENQQKEAIISLRKSNTLLDGIKNLVDSHNTLHAIINWEINYRLKDISTPLSYHTLFLTYFINLDTIVEAEYLLIGRWDIVSQTVYVIMNRLDAFNNKKAAKTALNDLNLALRYVASFGESGDSERLKRILVAILDKELLSKEGIQCEELEEKVNLNPVQARQVTLAKASTLPLFKRPTSDKKLDNLNEGTLLDSDTESDFSDFERGKRTDNNLPLPKFCKSN